MSAGIGCKVAFRMPIPLACDEMVTLSLPGFRRDGGSGYLSGGPAVDDDYRFVIVHSPKGIDRSAFLQCTRHSCSVLLMFDSSSVRNVVGVIVTACMSCRVYWDSRAQNNYSLPSRPPFRRGKQSPWKWPVQLAFTFRGSESQKTAASWFF